MYESSEPAAAGAYRDFNGGATTLNETQDRALASLTTATLTRRLPILNIQYGTTLSFRPNSLAVFHGFTKRELLLHSLQSPESTQNLSIPFPDPWGKARLDQTSSWSHELYYE